MSAWDQFTSGFWRKLGFAAAAFLIAAVVGKANAAIPTGTESPPPTTGCIRSSDTDTSVTCADQGFAFAGCQQVITTIKAVPAYSNYNPTCTVNGATYTCQDSSAQLPCNNFTAVPANSRANTFSWPTGKTCPTRTNLANGYIKGSSDTVCSNGCQFTTQGRGSVRINFGALGEGWTQSVAGFAPTGSTCSLDTEQPANKEECIPIAGQSVCKLEDGRLCYSLTTSRRNCWTAGETGQKTDGNIAQVRNVGTESQPPNIGQPTQPIGTPITTTTNTTTTNNTTTTTNITTSNHTTSSGLPAGSTNDGQSTNTDGTGIGTSGGTTGGTGTDMAATNALLDAIKTNTSKGSGVIGGCTELGSPMNFACSGDPAGCIAAEELARQECREQAKDSDGNGQPDWTQGDGPGDGSDPDGDAQAVEDSKKFGIDLGPDILDQDNIFGNGSCPEFSMTIAGQTVTTAEIPYWCTIVSIMAAAILLMAAFMSLRILQGGN